MGSRYSAIYGIAKSPQLCMTDEEIHLLVAGLTGKDSLRKLDQREIMEVTVRLQEMKDGASAGKRRRNFTHSGNRATVRQRRKIYMLMKELGWNDARVRGFAERMTGTKIVEWMDYNQCYKVIEGMKKLLERQEGEKNGNDV